MVQTNVNGKLIWDSVTEIKGLFFMTGYISIEQIHHGESRDRSTASNAISQTTNSHISRSTRLQIANPQFIIHLPHPSSRKNSIPFISPSLLHPYELRFSTSAETGIAWSSSLEAQEGWHAGSEFQEVLLRGSRREMEAKEPEEGIGLIGRREEPRPVSDIWIQGTYSQELQSRFKKSAR